MINTLLHPKEKNGPSPKARHRFRSAMGLTLIELLIVIAIIAVLAALTLPVVNATRNSARNATCVVNLKQMGSAVLRFVADNQGRIPPSKLADDVRAKETASPKPNAYWVVRLYHEGYIPGPLEDGTPLNSSVFCPSFTPGGPPDQRHHTYGLRDWRGTKIQTGEYLRISQIEAPSRFFLLADSIQVSSQSQWYAIQSEGGNNGAHLRHNGRANTFFADGHIEAMDAEYFQTLPVNQPEFSRRPYKVVDIDGNAF